MDIDRAKAVAAMASVLVDTARVETKHLRMMDDAGSSQFMDESSVVRRLSSTPTAHNPFPQTKNI